MQMRLMGVLGAGEDKDTAVDVATDVLVTDRGDGTYACRYKVKADTPGQEGARLEVRVNGGHVSASPFQVAIKEVKRGSISWRRLTTRACCTILRPAAGRAPTPTRTTRVGNCETTSPFPPPPSPHDKIRAYRVRCLSTGTATCCHKHLLSNICCQQVQMFVNRYSNMSNIVTCSYDDRAFFAILRNPRRRERLLSLCLCRQGSKRWRRCLDAGLRDDVPPPSSTLPSPT